jgi:hypothetical protein
VKGFVKDYPLVIRHRSGKNTHVLYNATTFKNEAGELRRTRKDGIPYHEFECASCGKKGSRHQVSARVSALLLKRAIEHGYTADARAAFTSRSPAGFL